MLIYVCQATHAISCIEGKELELKYDLTLLVEPVVDKDIVTVSPSITDVDLLTHMLFFCWTVFYTSATIIFINWYRFSNVQMFWEK